MVLLASRHPCLEEGDDVELVAREEVLGVFFGVDPAL